MLVRSFSSTLWMNGYEIGLNGSLKIMYQRKIGHHFGNGWTAHLFFRIWPLYWQKQWSNTKQKMRYLTVGKYRCHLIFCQNTISNEPSSLISQPFTPNLGQVYLTSTSGYFLSFCPQVFHSICNAKTHYIWVCFYIVWSPCSSFKNTLCCIQVCHHPCVHKHYPTYL